MVGSDRSPMVTTVAPTMPVDAANSAPTSVTDMPRPPRMVPNRRPMFSSSSSATRLRSSITPMKTKSGTAISVSFVMVPKMRCGKAPRKERSKTPSAAPRMAKISAVPASVKATGKPASRNRQAVANMAMSRMSAMAIRRYPAEFHHSAFPGQKGCADCGGPVRRLARPRVPQRR